MTPSETDRHARELLAHGDWLRRIARDLVRDVDAAEELVQDTYVTALRRPPSVGVASMRAWLATLVRNLARDRARSERSRREREAHVTRTEPLESSDDTVARIESAEALIAALGRLEEPYRSTLVARYFDGRSAAEIARSAGVPAATVRWRLQRALELLRAELAGSSRGRGMHSMLVLLARAPETIWTTAAISAAMGVLAMHTAFKFAAVAVLLALAGIGWWTFGGSEASQPVEGAMAALPPAAQGAELAIERERAPVPGARSDASSAAGGSARPSADPAAAPAVAGTQARIEARFLDGAKRPIAAGELVLASLAGMPRGTTGADGRVVLFVELGIDGRPSAGLDTVAEARAERFATRFERLKLAPGETCVLGDLVFDPGASIAGLVRHADGRPFPGASVLATDTEEFGGLARARRFGPSYWPGAPSTVSDAHGRFEVRGVAPGARRCWAGAEGMRYTVSAVLELVPHGRHDDLVLDLEPLASDERIRGRVEAPDGAPVPRASVRYVVRQGGGSSSSTLTCDDEGRFDLRMSLVAPHDFRASDPEDRYAPVELLAVPAGTLEAVLRFQTPKYVTLDVVDERGRGVPSYTARLQALDGAELEQRSSAPAEGGTSRLRCPGHPFRLAIDARGFALAELGPLDPATLLERQRIELQPVPGLRGRVLSGGTRLEGVVVRLYELASSEQTVNVGGFQARVLPDAETTDRSDAQGEFFLTLRRDGEFAILAKSADGRVAELGPLAVTAARGASDLTVVFEPGGAIEGRVLLPKGSNPEGVIVTINRGDLEPRSRRLGTDGAFRFDGLTPGEWQVRRTEIEAGTVTGWGIGRGSEATRFRGDCRVRAGETTRHDLDLTDERPCTLVGRLRVDGEPASRWTVALWPASGVSVDEVLPSGALDAQGRFRISIAKPGAYGVRFADEAPGGSFEFQVSAVLARGEESLDYELSTTRLEGRVADPARRDGLFAVWKGEHGEFAWLPIRCDAGGVFALARVPIGPIELLRSVGTDGSWESLKKVELAKGAPSRVELP